MDDVVAEIRRRARERIGGRREMRIDGNAIELLARAHERHAARLDGARRALTDVGSANYLGDTSEGSIVTTNYRASALTSPDSLEAAVVRQQNDARAIAALLRSMNAGLAATDHDGGAAITQAER